MKTGKVIGNIWATRKEERLSGMKLLIVQPFNPADDTEIEFPVIASDIIGAGIGEKVLYVNGSSARAAWREDRRYRWMLPSWPLLTIRRLSDRLAVR